MGLQVFSSEWETKKIEEETLEADRLEAGQCKADGKERPDRMDGAGSGGLLGPSRAGTDHKTQTEMPTIEMQSVQEQSHSVGLVLVGRYKFPFRRYDASDHELQNAGPRRENLPLVFLWQVSRKECA